MTREDMQKFTKEKEKIMENLRELRVKLEKNLRANEEWDYDMDDRRAAQKEKKELLGEKGQEEP